MTFIAALRCDRIDAPLVIDGPINGESFAAYVEQVLVPTLKVRIPTQSGRGFRFDVGHRSDLIPATIPK